MKDKICPYCDEPIRWYDFFIIKHKHCELLEVMRNEFHSQKQEKKQ